MEFVDLRRRVTEAFPGLSPRLQSAARHVLDRPDDVALKSMRKVSMDADVHPSTMVRLARTFGFKGYTEFRQTFQDHLRDRPMDHLSRARTLQARRRGSAPGDLIEEALTAQSENLRETFAINRPQVLQDAAGLLSSADRVFVVGMRSCFPIAFAFHYVHRMFRSNSVLLDGRSGTFADDLRDLGPGDVVFAISVEPYSQETVRAVEFARRRGARAVVMTDSHVSPLTAGADCCLVVRKENPSFFDSIASAISLAEVLNALMVADGGEAALKALAESEEQLDAFGAYVQRGDRRGPGLAGARRSKKGGNR